MGVAQSLNMTAIQEPRKFKDGVHSFWQFRISVLLADFPQKLLCPASLFKKKSLIYRTFFFICIMAIIGFFWTEEMFR